MKKVLGIVGAVGVLIVGTYYGSGWLTEHAFQKTIRDIRATKGYNLSVLEYHRGFFHSTSVVEWIVHVPPQNNTLPNGQVQTTPATDYLIPIKLSIIHGPIIFAKDGVRFGLGYAHTQLTIPEKYRNQLYNHFNPSSTLPRLKIGLLINFLNQAKIKVAVPEFHMTMLQDEGEITWSGLTSSSLLSLNLSRMKGDAQLAKASLHRKNIMMDIEDVSSEYDISRTPLGLYDGDAHFKLRALKVASQGQMQFALNQFEVNTENEEDNGLFNSSLKATLDTVIVEGVTYGPGLLEMALKNLDAQVLSKINHDLQSIDQLSLIARQKVLFSLLPELPHLFSKGASFTISELNFGMPEGKIKGDLTLSLPKSTTNNPFQLFSQVAGSAHAQIPVKVVRDVMENAVRIKLQESTSTDQPTVMSQSPVIPASNNLEQEVQTLTDKRMSSLVESGVLVQRGQDYTMDVKLEQGKMMVNGKPFTPAMLEF